MNAPLKYETLERLPVSSPVDRIDFITALCRNKRVLDIGCLDETALMKRDTQYWLHGRISTVALKVTGIDNSSKIPEEGISTGPNARIIRGDGSNPDSNQVDCAAIDIIVAGEFIEHLECPMAFLRNMKQRFLGHDLIISTPNGTSFANALLGMIGREAQHPDHVMTSTYKTLNTLCSRAGFTTWRIIPYRFFATEMLMQSKGVKKIIIRCVEIFIRLVEKIFPLRSFGYIVQIKI
jgi:2-polyprenyl-3-methyl-5-hydroxy-6-metoxy-1,4-benzoquinol methylase